MKDGYNVVDGLHNSYNIDKKWKKVWNKDGLPKINLFFWILAHCKTLTGENIRKRGMEGHLRCILCKESEESLEHLFIECKFSREVWNQAYKDLHFDLILPTNWNDIFACWKDYYHRSLSNKSDFVGSWEALPRYI